MNPPIHNDQRRFYRLVILFLVYLAILAPQTLPAARAQTELCTQPFRPVATPLTDLGKNTYVRMDGQTTTYTGGLYPDGSNVRPPQHEAAGLAIASQITPLNKDGQPDPKGSIVMISVGMSNASAEFLTFMSLADKTQGINPNLVFINGALGGQTAERWVSPDSLPWNMLKTELARYDHTADQVQVAWVKETLTRGGDFPSKAQLLEGYLEAIAQNLKINFPNIKIAYLSSRTRSFTYWRGLSPEPLAYETGFAVKWLIEKQIDGDPALNFDPGRGDVKAPYLSWGPYLWIDGTNPRSDGRVWTAEDMAQDCTHPSQTGMDKVADMLMQFFKSDTVAASWFLASGSISAAPTPTPIQAPRTMETAIPAAVPTSTAPPNPAQTPYPAAPTRTADQALPTDASVTSTPTIPQAQAPAVGYIVLALVLVSAGLMSGWYLFRKK